ncbi:MAG: glutamate racemase [Candidatus Omnitrophica bacterium]|nr:glutamate racemase [Candidatus Omnitrophota bacterium]
MKRPIGVFDSGIGGLTVVKEIIKCLPHENIIYFGDTARVPYGTKSPRTVIKFSIENTLFLLRFKVKLIVVACNTSSSYSIPILKNNFKVPIIEVINPGVEEAVKVTRCGRIGVIGTTATIQSGAYEKEIKKVNPHLKVFNQPCPLFVPLVEEGWLNDKATFDIAFRYLKPLKDKKIDTLILGCTHYPLLKKVIRNVMGLGVILVDSAKQVACCVKDILVREDFLSNSSKKNGIYKFYVSDESKKFTETAKKFLGREIKLIKRESEYV